MSTVVATPPAPRSTPGAAKRVSRRPMERADSSPMVVRDEIAHANVDLLAAPAVEAVADRRAPASTATGRYCAACGGRGGFSHADWSFPMQTWVNQRTVPCDICHGAGTIVLPPI